MRFYTKDATLSIHIAFPLQSEDFGINPLLKYCKSHQYFIAIMEMTMQKMGNSFIFYVHLEKCFDAFFPNTLIFFFDELFFFFHSWKTVQVIWNMRNGENRANYFTWIPLVIKSTSIKMSSRLRAGHFMGVQPEKKIVKNFKNKTIGMKNQCWSSTFWSLNCLVKFTF